jgi:enoyl-[acyl-carrier protein] reductase/trans-2-enoyl-CoA reductase (NAD+)
MPVQLVPQRIRGFISVSAHPVGCATNVEREIALATQGTPGKGWRDILVAGASTGYGLSSLVSGMFGYGARGFGVCLERPPVGNKTASAGWYNLAALERLAAAAGKSVSIVNGDAFSNDTKAATIARLKAAGAKLDCFVYSLATARRIDPKTGAIYNSALKPIGAPFRSKTINLSNDQLVDLEIPPANADEIEATRRVMGGEDFALWTNALLEAGLLAEGCRAVAYSYVGPRLNDPIYRAGTIGRAKEDLEATTTALSATLKSKLGGAAYVSVNKALVTQASAVIPMVPLYISLLFKVMKEAGTHEGTAEQIVRMFRDHLGPGRTPTLDAEGRIRIDDWEMAPAIQDRVAALWPQVTTENLFQVTDYAGFKQDFYRFFGYDVPGVDYTVPVETDVPIASVAT